MFPFSFETAELKPSDSWKERSLERVTLGSMMTRSLTLLDTQSFQPNESGTATNPPHVPEEELNHGGDGVSAY